MKTDYKFWYVTREDDVHISECAVRFSEGDVTTLDEFDVATETNKSVTRYRRSKRLQTTDLPHFSGRKVKKEMSGDDCIIFTSDDFGVITSTDELRKFLNKELKKDINRTPIVEQEDNQDEQ